ncbi:MAG: aryl-sulfate sulfotransferase [Firmicutes bacterium]|nr:aryl-sulfate sulfotransferase [Bacillota bacterium]
MKTKAGLILLLVSATLLVAITVTSMGMALFGWFTPNQDEFRVTFRFNNGENDLVYIVNSGGHIRPPVEPELLGHNFVGWFATNIPQSHFDLSHSEAPTWDRSTQWNFTSRTVTQDITLYAGYDRAFSHLTHIQSSLHGRGIHEIYNENNQQAVRYEIDHLKTLFPRALSQTDHHMGPLLIHNPFGTTPLGVFVYFITPAAQATIRYTVIIDGVPDFTRYVGGDLTNTHEFMAMGFVSGRPATLRIETLNAANNVIFTRVFEDIVVTYAGALDNLTVTIQAGREQDLSDGMFVKQYGNHGSIMGDIAIFCNDGFQRLALRSNLSAHGFEIDNDGNFVFGATNQIITRVSRLGEVVGLYHAPGYTFTHSFVLGPNNDILASATYNPSIRWMDIVLRMSRCETTGQLSHEELLNMRDFFPLSFAQSVNNVTNNWFHLNSLDLVKQGSTYGLVVSSRHTNSIIFFTDIYNNPTVEWVMTEDPVMRQHTNLTFIDKINNPTTGQSPRPTSGQHTPTMQRTTGGYLLHVFNNFVNPIATASHNEQYDFTQFPLLDLTGLGITSFAETWFIEDGTGNAWLVNSMEMPFSMIMSGVHNLDDHLHGNSTNIVATSQGGRITREFDMDGNLIATFTHSIQFFRTIKVNI